MSPKKKGYKKRLPTVLPPAPRPAPEQDMAWPRPEPAATPAPTPEPPPAPPLRVKTSRRPPSRKVRVGLVLALVILVVDIGLVTAALLRGFDDEAGPRQADTDDTSVLGDLVPDTSYVVSRVLPDGDVVVRQRIRAADPVHLVQLELPLVPGADVSAHQVDVEADGEPVVGPASINDGLGTYTFAPATDLQISYRITGAVELSGSVPGRALAVVTTLDISYGEQVERETRVVRAAEVLALACSRSVEQAPVPCGKADGEGRWTVELTGAHVADRVVAQVTLG